MNERMKRLRQADRDALLRMERPFTGCDGCDNQANQRHCSLRNDCFPFGDPALEHYDSPEEYFANTDYTPVGAKP